MASRDELDGVGKPWGMIIEGVFGTIFCAVAVTFMSPMLYWAYEHGIIWKRDKSSPGRGRYVSVITEPGEFWRVLGFYLVWIVLLFGSVLWRIRKHYRAYNGRPRSETLS